MTTLITSMQDHLFQYQALAQHQTDFPHQLELDLLRSWQTARLLETHQLLLQDPSYRQATEFVLYDVYRGIDLYNVSLDIERALPVVAKLFPTNVIETAALALEINLLTAQLDETLMRVHFHELGYSSISEQSYIEACHQADQFELRERQIELTRSLGRKLDKYIDSRMIYAGFKVAKRPAYAAGIHALYDFMDRGFTVLRPLGGAEQFLEAITRAEQALLANIKNRAPNPFTWRAVAS